MVEKVDAKVRTAKLYDVEGKRWITVSGATAREILGHPQQKSEAGPRFLTEAEKLAREADAALEERAEKLAAKAATKKS